MMEKLEFHNKVILAPMVRICGLPTRLLALRYGADIVYCEEIIDFKILAAERRVNDLIGTIDYVLTDGTIVFRTCPELEKKKLVFQLGTSDAERALKAAKKIENDVSAVDVNMGCPKEFSIKGGMGAALLKQPEKIKTILTTLVSGLSVPVTCKIRILPTLEETLALVRLIEATGVAAIAVHGRTRSERPRHKNHNDVIKAITEAVNIPVIANGGSGDIHRFEDIENFRAETGASAVMVARAAQWNVSIFRKDGILPVLDVVKEFLKCAIDFDNQYTNTKYCILQLMHSDMHREEGLDTQCSQCVEDICKIWGFENYHREFQRKKDIHMQQSQQKIWDIDPEIKQWQTTEGELCIQMPVRFIRKDYPVAISPKQKLFVWAHQNRTASPVYLTEERTEDRCFKTFVTVEGCRYSTPFWEKSKQISEQGAAICALIVLGLEDGRKDGVSSPNDCVAKKWEEFKKCSQIQSSASHCDPCNVDSGGNLSLVGEITDCYNSELANHTDQVESLGNDNKRKDKMDGDDNCEEGLSENEMAKKKMRTGLDSGGGNNNS